MTDPHYSPAYLAQPHVQAAVDQRRAEVADLAGQVRRHRDDGCPSMAACPGTPVTGRLAGMCDHRRFDLLVAALILLADKDAEVRSLRVQLGSQGAV
ncbi:hypothetical protein [Micromonospora aurantiaca (nom. illeg.)]|uniref:Uncharacterized protein n=1 Tax=Micromonospora aurantiaca (nom. illeg.) TaxID=47850 RepID=A0ABQ6UP04_9ACTN|nr:hypothetical protein [Micromonospora aurantiaca]KAB1119072.1 hypothetical protein F6X54_01355 [Micromonospora aurantiaca]MBC9005687.1 hypothetical protein [Micromonospora aurantiaca]